MRKKDDQLDRRIDNSPTEKKLLQYSRRKFKSKQRCFPVASVTEIPEADIIDSKFNNFTLDGGNQEYQFICKSNNEEVALSPASLVNQSTLASTRKRSLKEVCDVQRELYSSADLHNTVILDAEGDMLKD
ncbi:hypothetical protein VNO78_02706 [Psophocarpus tetragonolobus]|uniref:Uncharacterized protein n=1 Tax=Psophocarpus tetragonolobus TaxID=3891 RepID=A0AAN9XVD7_PSOTE